MEVEFDPAKRDQVLAERGIDIARGGEVFDGFLLTRRDDKHSSDEERFISIGLLDADVVIVPWTSRGTRRRIVTMWKANDRERQNYQDARERSGRDQA